MVLSSFILLVVLACYAPVSQSKPSRMIGIMMMQGGRDGDELSSISCDDKGVDLMRALKGIEHNLSQRLDALDAKVNALGEGGKQVTSQSTPSTSSTEDYETDVEDCSTSSCLNNGICVNDSDGHTCMCTSGWTGHYCESELVECKTTALGSEYVGTASETVTGKACQAWTSQSPHKHTHTDDSKYPDGSAALARNFCRNPDNDPVGPWCYTTDPVTRWEECKVEFCSNRCPAGFKPITQSGGCYKVILESLNWTQSQSRCHQLDPRAHLAVITSEEENTAVVSYLKSLNETETEACGASDRLSFFMSGQRIEYAHCSSPFVWKLNATTAIPLTYTSWAPDEPNCLHGESCLHYYSHFDYKWNDYSCSSIGCSVCQLNMYPHADTVEKQSMRPPQ